MPVMLKSPETFQQRLERAGLALRRGRATTLQINVGLLCDLACRHCHLEAGPQRTEVMARKTMDEVIALARRSEFALADITGGAPEFVPDLPYLLEGLAPVVPRLMLRTNLTAFTTPQGTELLKLCQRHRVAIVASLPSTSASQADGQRGRGVWDKSIAMLRHLNTLGYGRDGSELELHLVANPPGAFLPAGQAQTEKKFKHDLQQRSGVVFNRLFTFANAPLGRFRHWLESSGNLEAYLTRLADGFNPCTLDGVMCRTLVSVAWDGRVYDCDFNLAAGLGLGGRRIHVSELPGAPLEGSPIAVGDHCYACTAGSGFT